MSSEFLRGEPRLPIRVAFIDANRPRCARACRDAAMGLVVQQLRNGKYGVYGARKTWKAARRAGHDLGRDRVGWLNAGCRYRRARRGKRVRTTKPDPAAARYPDLVKRDFTATAPNQLWVTDLTYVPT